MADQDEVKEPERKRAAVEITDTPGQFLITVNQEAVDSLTRVHDEAAAKAKALSEKGAPDAQIKAAEDRYNKQARNVADNIASRLSNPGQKTLVDHNAKLVDMLKGIWAGVKDELIGGYQPKQHPTMGKLFAELAEACED